MINWVVVDRIDILGKVYCATLNCAMCSSFVPGINPDKDTRHEFAIWKSVAECTLIKIAMKHPEWYPTVDFLNYMVGILRQGNEEVFYAGCAITGTDLIGNISIGQLFVARAGPLRIQCLVESRSNGIHIERSLIGSELEVWKTMKKGLTE